MKITKVFGREIFDSRGWPTIQCEIELDGTHWVSAAAPSSIACGSGEAVELRDGGPRLWGRGVLRGVEYIDYVISPALVGKEPNGPLMDKILIEIDNTADKSHLGSNTMLSVSMAVHRAQALYEGVELFELISHLIGCGTVTIPFPQVVMLNGGIHAHMELPFKEFLVVPIGMHHFRSSMELAVGIFHELQGVLERYGRRTLVSDLGGFVSNVTTDEALLALCESMHRLATNNESQSVIALDISASQIFDAESNTYRFGEKELSSHDLIEWYAHLIDTYPIYSLEDPLAADDWEGWSKLMQTVGDKIQIIADELCATNSARIERAIKERCMTAVSIKPNQVGTVSETLQAIQMCRLNSLNVIIACRDGETNDSFNADLAVGVSSGQIKAGGCCRGERIAKYNRLLEIEDALFWNLLND